MNEFIVAALVFALPFCILVWFIFVISSDNDRLKEENKVMHKAITQISAWNKHECDVYGFKAREICRKCIDKINNLDKDK